jgi:hypothetical protein
MATAGQAAEISFLVVRRDCLLSNHAPIILLRAGDNGFSETICRLLKVICISKGGVFESN